MMDADTVPMWFESGAKEVATSEGRWRRPILSRGVFEVGKGVVIVFGGVPWSATKEMVGGVWIPGWVRWVLAPDPSRGVSG